MAHMLGQEGDITDDSIDQATKPHQNPTLFALVGSASAACRFFWACLASLSALSWADHWEKLLTASLES